MSTISAAPVTDIRFPTSQLLDGSDAMNRDPDYSAAYIQLQTDAADGLTGDGFVFTIGRGNNVATEALRMLGESLVGKNVEAFLDDMGQTYRHFVYDSQLRWLGPEKGVMHMAIGAVVNALWDLKAKRAGLPLWQLLASLSPEELVDLVDFRYISDALSKDDALEILRKQEPTKQERIDQLRQIGYPAYTTTPGWLGYSDEKMARLCSEALDQGFKQIKLKVGLNLQDDLRRLEIASGIVGDRARLAVDANQNWDVNQAIQWIREFEKYNLTWIEEPTHPDDVVGHATIANQVKVPIATGEHAANRVVFKQLLQEEGLLIMQIDAARVGGVNENISNLLLAAKYNIPVCPHAGGVGLCEMVQHLSMFDFVAVSGVQENRMIEYVDHLHEHFVSPVKVSEGKYWPPEQPGAGTEMLPSSRDEYAVTH